MKHFNIFDTACEYDAEDPDGYRAGAHRIGPELDGARLGATVYELPPGQALCPYHYETEEEWLLLMQGELTVRTPDGETVLRPGDVTAFPTGPAGAHKTTNNGSETVRLLMWSNVDPSGYCVYPDSDKITYWAPGERKRIHRGAEATYYEGEPLP
jgi:uncharacterized cupin superfamily protein